MHSSCELRKFAMQAFKAPTIAPSEEWQPPAEWHLWKMPKRAEELTSLQKFFGVAPLKEITLQKADVDTSVGVTLQMDGGHTIISGLEPGGLAERDGLKLGNRVHAINGRMIRNANHVTKLIKESVGDVKIGLTTGTPPRGTKARALRDYKEHAKYIHMYAIPCGILNWGGGYFAWQVSSHVGGLEDEDALVGSTGYALKMCCRIFCATAVSVVVVFAVGIVLILLSYAFKTHTIVQKDGWVIIMIYVIGFVWQIVLVQFTLMFRASAKALQNSGTKTGGNKFYAGSQFVW